MTSDTGLACFPEELKPLSTSALVHYPLAYKQLKGGEVYLGSFFRTEPMVGWILFLWLW